MDQSENKIITEESFREWLASTGNLFPSNKLELSRFEKLYSDYKYLLDENCVDPFAIIDGTFIPKKINLKLESDSIDSNIRMAARNLENFPEHILQRIKRNQNEPRSEEKGDSEIQDQ